MISNKSIEESARNSANLRTKSRPDCITIFLVLPLRQMRQGNLLPIKNSNINDPRWEGISGCELLKSRYRQIPK